MEFKFQDFLGFMLGKTAKKFKGELSRRFTAYDITPEQWALLNQLWEQDGISQKELSDRLVKDQPTTTRILDKLECKGFIRRQCDPTDRRAFLIFLTDQGQGLKQTLIPLAEQALEKATYGFSPADLAQLKEYLAKLSANLDSVKQ
ncbi:MAG TPA: MarR family transcriptional regulator [Desulfobacteria bacterium]|nr:MarR family transcriptional regulator [Desulfobacteria bacterium]